MSQSYESGLHHYGTVAQSHSSWASGGEALTKLSSKLLIGASDSFTLI